MRYYLIRNGMHFSCFLIPSVYVRFNFGAVFLKTYVEQELAAKGFFEVKIDTFHEQFAIK